MSDISEPANSPADPGQADDFPPSRPTEGQPQAPETSAASTATSDQVSTAPPTVTSGQAKPSGSKKGIWLTIVILLIVAVAAVAYMLLRPAHKAATATKQDIPLINYGLSDGTFDQTYPLGSSNTSAMTQVNSQLFEGLVRYQNQTKIVPLLATNWYNPDDTTWVFNLQHNITFHSGRAMTAQDVKYSLDYAVAHQNDSNAAASLAVASTIKSVDVVNPYQVKITTDGPDPALLNRLTRLYIFDSKTKLGDPDAGTGPYILKPGSKITATNLELTAVNNYWGGHVYTRAVHFGAVTDKAKLATDTANGEFDLAGDMTDSQLAKIHTYRVINVEDLGVSFLGLNTLKAGSPLESLAARQAAAYALNIPAILKAAGLRGQQASQLVPLTILGHDPSIKDTPYNPTKARQLLASVKNVSTPLMLSYPAGDTAQVTEIAKELDAVGFNVQLSQQPDVGSLVNVAFGGQTDMFYISYESDILDGLDIYSSIVIGNSDYNNAQVNSLTTQASSTLDSATRISLLQKIGRQIAADVPDIPLYTQTRSYALTKPYHIQVDIPSNEAGAYFWQVYRQ